MRTDNNKNIDKLFRDSLEGAHIPPPPEVLNNIHDAIRKKKPRNKFLFWFLFIILVSNLLVLGLYPLFSSEEKIVDAETPSVNQKDISKFLAEDTTILAARQERKSDESYIETSSEEQEIIVAEVEQKLNEAIKSKAKPKKVKLTPEIVIENNSQPIVAEKSVDQKVKEKIKTPHSEHKALVIAEKESEEKEEPLLASNYNQMDLSLGQSINLNPELDEEISVKLKAERLARKKRVSNKKNKEEKSSQSKTQESPLVDDGINNNADGKDEQSSSLEEKQEEGKGETDNDESAGSKESESEVVVNETRENSDEEIQDKEVIDSTQSKPELNIASKDGKKGSGISVQAYGSVSGYSPKFNGTINPMDFINNQEDTSTGTRTYGGGVDVNYSIKSLEIEAGLQVHTQELVHNFESVSWDRWRTAVQYTDSALVDTSNNVYVYTDSTETFDSSKVVTQNSRTNRLKYIEIPFTIGYKKRMKRFEFVIHGGVIYGRVLGANGDLNSGDTVSGNSGIPRNTNLEINRNRLFAVTDLEFRYYLKNLPCYTFAAADFKYSLNSFYKNVPDVKSVRYGIQVGVGFNF